MLSSYRYSVSLDTTFTNLRKNDNPWNQYFTEDSQGCSGRLLGSSLTEEGTTRTDTTELVLFGLFFGPLFEVCVQLRYLLLHLLELESCRLLGSSLTEEGSYLGLVLFGLH